MKINLDRINKELKRKGWSRYRLAKEMDVPPNSIYTNLKKGSFKTVGKISKALGVPEKELVVGE